MRKISVKHYLEKRLKPLELKELHYPVYIQIIIDRKTTQYRSLSEAYMSESNFEKYKNNKPFDGWFIEMGALSKEFFEKEPERILKSFQQMIKEYKGTKIDRITAKDMFSYMNEYYLMSKDISLIKLCWNYQLSQKGKRELYQPFDKSTNLIESINNLESFFDIEIKNKIPEDDLVFWYNVQNLLSNSKSEHYLIDLIDTYITDIQQIDKIKNKVDFTLQIYNIIKYDPLSN